MSIVINTRVLNARLTGAQRYVLELVNRFGRDIESISPVHCVNGFRAHAWEQFALPRQLKGRLLFSPSNSGPLLYDNQVVSILDVVPLDHPEWLNKNFAIWYRFMLPRLAHHVKHVITISEFSKSRIVEMTGIGIEKVTVTPLGVDSRFSKKPLIDIEHAKGSLNIQSCSYILCLGSLEPRKNLQKLLAAWSIVVDKIPDDIWLVVAGGEGSKKVFQKSNLDTKISRVQFLGHVDDSFLPALYSGAIAFVYPSVYEGFGLPPLEAMACGTPVMTGNRTSLSEVVGDCGVMVDPYDVDAIADGIVRLIENTELRLDLSIRGLKRASNFNWQNTSNLTLKILQAAE